MNWFDFPPVRIQTVALKNNPNDVQLDVLREDEIHPFVSGNKIRKLKYNLFAYQKGDFQRLRTFGGAFSNHLAATAYACFLQEIPAMGMVRGEELAAKKRNPTLAFCEQHGMRLQFISRSEYKRFTQELSTTELQNIFTNEYVLPEGGTNDLAIKGTSEILDDRTRSYTHIAVSIGTGGTFLGLLSAAHPYQKVLGFSAVRTDEGLPEFLQKKIPSQNYAYLTAYNLGGYAKINLEYIKFVNEFQRENKIPLDAVYTGKMMLGLTRKIAGGEFARNAKILAIHTGGLQGNSGMNERLKKLKLPLITPL